MNGSHRRVCLFAQHHPRGRVRGPVLDYVRALRDCGYEVHLAASAPAPPPEEDQDALAATGAVLHPRENAGLDFGAWQHLIDSGCTDGADSILLANDSVFGPFHPLPPILARMAGHDVWGMIESAQRNWHLQSWFLHFRADAFRHPEVQRVFRLPFATMDKEAIIAQGELGLGVALRRAGLRCDAVVRHADATWFARRHELNMMHLDWRHNLRALGLPFLKAELVRSNPMRLPWAPLWDQTLRDLGADPAPIHAYLLDYTGRKGASWTVPVRPLPWRLYLGFLLATHDRGVALRTFDPLNLRWSLGNDRLAG